MYSCVDLSHVSHFIFVIEGHCLFCQACGGYSFKRTRKLYDSCSRRCSSAAVAKRRDRLMLGCHPITNAFLGLPRGLSDPSYEMFLYLDTAVSKCVDDHASVDLASQGT